MVFCLFCTLLSVNCLFLSVNCKDARVISLKPRCACTGVVYDLMTRPDMSIKVKRKKTSRYANVEQGCEYGKYGTIRMASFVYTILLQRYVIPDQISFEFVTLAGSAFPFTWLSWSVPPEIRLLFSCRLCNRLPTVDSQKQSAR